MGNSNAFPADLRFHIDESNLAVRARQLRARLKLLPAMILSQLVVETFFVWLMWEELAAAHHYLVLWLGVAYSLHLLEFIRWRYYRRKTVTVAECRSWSRYFFLFALSVGSLWGIYTLFFLPHNPQTQMVLICAMLGLAAGSAATNATHLPSLYAYVLSLMLPLTFRTMTEPGIAHIALGAFMLVFLAVVLTSGHLLHKLLLLSLRQRFENQSLLQQLAEKNDELEQKVEERSAQLRHKSEEVAHVRDVTIVAMGILAETRDNETGNHLKRTQNYIRTLAHKLRDHHRFRDFLTGDNIEALHKLAPLHDIGKVGIPDHILLKPGKLTAEEFETMKTHTLLGEEVLAVAESHLPAPSRFLHIAREIALGHHEKWDGSGYPLGLKGDAIPIAARLMSIADVYDALISQRPYKRAFSHEEALEIILQGHSTHFDPDLVDAFLSLQDEFRNIAERYRDETAAV